MDAFVPVKWPLFMQAISSHKTQAYVLDVLNLGIVTVNRLDLSKVDLPRVDYIEYLHSHIQNEPSDPRLS